MDHIVSKYLQNTLSHNQYRTSTGYNIARNVKLKFALTMFNNIDIVIRFKKVHKDLGA